MVSAPDFRLRKTGEVPYSKNVEVDRHSADSGSEEENLRNVFAAMDELMRTPTLAAGAVMPDACPTGPVSIPVGCVVAAEDAIHPGFHSADICCSVMATNFGERWDPESVLNVAQKVTHFGSGGRTRSAGIFKHLTRELEDRIRGNPLFTTHDLKKAQLHLGTQGDGNHFLFVGRSENHGGVVVVTHHGSRGFGAGLYTTGMRIAERFRKELSPETHPENAWIPSGSAEGRQYWEALQVVRGWTRLNHEVIHGLIARKLGFGHFEGVSGGERTFWNEHNFVFRREAAGSHGKDIFLHAKGATPLDDALVPDSHQGLRLIPLNMAQPVLVVKGQTDSTNLGFAPHGAGRVISRTSHKRMRHSLGKTDEQLFREETDGFDVRFFSNVIDIAELPSAYRSATQVQRQMAKFQLGEVVDRIQPFGCIMSGSEPIRPKR